MVFLVKLQIMIILICIFQGVLLAQDLVSYSASETMAHDHINCIYHDPDGYVWIGTRDGLSRYDGHTFSVYRNDPRDTTTIPDNTIQKIVEDKTGGIWIVTRSGITKYQYKTNTFQRVHFQKDNLSLEYGLSYICFDNTGKGWLVRDKALVSFNTRLTAIRYIDISGFYHESGKLIQDANGLWIASWKGLLHFSWQTLGNKPKLTAEDADDSYRFRDERNRNLKITFIHTTNGEFLLDVQNHETGLEELFINDEETHALIHIPIPVSKDGLPLVQLLGGIYEISPGKIFIAFDNKQAVLFNLQNRTFEFDHSVRNLIGGKIRSQIYCDQQENIWIGGMGGLHKYTKPQLRYRAWLNEEGKAGSLKGRIITSVYKDKQHHLWVGSRDGGLDRIDLWDNSVVNIKLPAELKKLAETNKVFDITALNDDELLINIDTVVFRYNVGKNKFSLFKTMNYHAYNIVSDSKANIWISSLKNMMVGKADDNYALFKRIQFKDSLLNTINPRDLCEDHSGQIWLACSIGLVRLNVEDPDASRIFVPPGSEKEPEVFCIHETKTGTLWLGTIRNGIYAFDPATEKFTKHYTTKEGLIDNSVNVIYEDHRGYLWMSTWKGIARFNPKTGRFDNYGTVNGLPFTEFNTNASCMDEDGTIYFGGEGGVIAFHPDSLVNFDTRAPLGIGSVNINGGLKELDYPLRNGKLVTLPYDQNSFVISFSSFDFRHPEDRIYRYRLLGVKDEWIQCQNNDRNAEFAGLKPGAYVFEVQSTYKDWPWILDETSVKIIIESPPFYQQQRFFILLAGVALLALITVVLLGMRNFSIRKEVEITRLEKEANQSNMNFLKSQMNPHFYFNTLNAINSFVLQNDARAANKYLTMFAKLMREILENSQNEFITVSEEHAVLQKYIQLQQLRFPGIFDFLIEEENDVAEMKIPPMLLQPFVENSVEYAFHGSKIKGLIRIGFRKIGSQLICEVTDNGIGIHQSQEIKVKTYRKSTALINITKRIDVLEKIYRVKIELNISQAFYENTDNPGTHITLKLPDFNQNKTV